VRRPPEPEEKLTGELGYLGIGGDAGFDHAIFAQLRLPVQ
jgi:hypothetical protein